MRRVLVWLMALLMLAIATALALVVFGNFSLKDPEGNVFFGWDSRRNRFRVAEKATLQLEGPHVFVGADGFTVVRTVPQGAAWKIVSETLPKSPLPVVRVHVDNAARTVFDVQLRETPVPESAVFADNPSRLLMVSDMEGEFDKFVALLQRQGVIDARLHWRYGAGHLALDGDFVDRGEHTTPLLWLIYRLDGEARAAGGRVHYILGNHEQLMMSGRKKYWSRRQVAFAKALGDDGDERMYSQATVLGAWLASKPVMARIGDHLLVHGGISQAFLGSDLDVDQANEQARPFLFTEVERIPEHAGQVLGKSGVTWYRGMALPGDEKYAQEADPKAHLRAVLARYGVKRIAIAHTIVPDIVLEQDGMLLRLDVHHAEQLPQAALYEAGMLWRVDAEGGRVRLDGTSKR